MLLRILLKFQFQKLMNISCETYKFVNIIVPFPDYHEKVIQATEENGSIVVYLILNLTIDVALMNVS